MKIQRVLAVALVAASSLEFFGCTVAPDPEPTATPEPTPSVTEEAPLVDSDVLFTITMTVEDDGGDPVEFTMTGHASQEWDAAGREAVKTSFIDQCVAMGGTVDDASLDTYGSTLMVIETSSTPAGSTLAGPLELGLGSPYYRQVAAGDGLTETSECLPGYLVTSTGEIASITNYETGSSSPDLSQWRSGHYGFFTAFGSAAVISDCEIELTALAIASGVEEVDGWAAEEPNESSCVIGYRGE